MSKVELGFVGQFPCDYTDQAQRITLQTQGNFSPDTIDFQAALRQGQHIGKSNIAVTPTIREMAVRIKAHGNATVSRIDLITHAGSGRVGLRGRVDLRRTIAGMAHEVHFADASTSDDLLQSPSLERAAFDEIAKDDQAKRELEQMKNKIAKGGQLHIYACNAGIAADTAEPLVQVIAEALGIQTFLFKAEMGFTLSEGGKWKFHLRFRKGGRDPATGAPNTESTDQVSDYRELDKLTPFIVASLVRK